MSELIEFNVFQPDVVSNPYPHYKRLRAESPVSKVTGGSYALWRYDDNVFALKHPEIFSSSAVRVLFAGEFFPFQDMEGDMMMSSDPPEHTRLRRLMTPMFTPSAFASLRSQIEAFVEESLQRVRDKDEFDMMEDVVLPLPIQTFFTLLGVPKSQFKQCKEYAESVATASTLLVSREGGDEAWYERMKQTIRDMSRFLKGLVASRRAEPKNDLLTALVQARDVDDRLSEGELMKMLFLLVLAGTESTQKLLGNMILTFMKHPDQYRMIREDASLIPNAFQEVLRYDGPALHMGRTVVQDVELSGTTIPAGSFCMMAYASANHDERKFENAEEFDILRASQGRIFHLAFGEGVHRCLGSNLASLQADVMLRKLIEHFSELSGDPKRAVYDTRNFIMRGLSKLPISPRRV